MNPQVAMVNWWLMVNKSLINGISSKKYLEWKDTGGYHSLSTQWDVNWPKGAPPKRRVVAYHLMKIKHQPRFVPFWAIFDTERLVLGDQPMKTKGLNWFVALTLQLCGIIIIPLDFGAGECSNFDVRQGVAWFIICMGMDEHIVTGVPTATVEIQPLCSSM